MEKFGKQLTPGTTKSRRLFTKIGMKFTHISQWFKPLFVTSIDPDTGVETEQLVEYVAQVPKAQSTYKPGRNRFKRACRNAGINRVQVERRIRDGEAPAAILTSMVQ